MWMTLRWPVPTGAALLLALAAPAPAMDVLSLSLEELTRLPVTTAAGFAQPRDEAPATTFVLHRAQWEALGARTVYDVLARVPGLHVAENGTATPQVVARGLRTIGNSEILWLLDGEPLNDPGTGGPPTAFTPGLAGLARIEVVRGPVSVVHGSHAFGAVVQLISQAAGEPGGRVNLAAGDFRHREALLDNGGAAGELRWRFSLARRSTDGDPDRVIRRDIQSLLDPLLGTQVTRAPDALPSDDAVNEVRLHLGWRNTTLRAWHYRNDAGGRLANEALDPGHRDEGRIDHLALEQTGSLPGLHTDWTLEGLLQRQEAALRNSLAPGTVLPIGSDGDVDFIAGTPLLFPEGVIARQRTETERVRVALNLLNTAWPGHRLRLSLGHERQALRERESRRNFGVGVIDGAAPAVPPTPLPNLAGTPLSLLPDDRRHLSFVALQDDWRLHERLLLNLGVRLDDYADFGASANPRVSLQWQATSATRLRLGHGTAFRAPSFTEQNLRNNPAFLGNPDLAPETLRSTELALEQGLAPGLRLDMTVFHYEARRLIDYAPRPPAIGIYAQNLEGREGRGGTVELTWQPQPGTQLNASLSAWDVRDADTGARAPFVPRHMATLNGWWEFAPRWTLGGGVTQVADRARECGDPRPAIDDNLWADLHLRTTALSPRLTLGLSVRNLADADLRDPTRNNGGLGPTVPDDLPLEGRRWLLEAEYRWGG